MDNLDRVWGRFHEERTAPLWDRFPGHYRALVVETNDPLQIHRIRFKCPELHDSNLKPEECPWAVPAPWLGGQGAGSWSHPCIGDIVWITWEKNHPYGPIWTGFATPTRRKFYPLESIYTESPLAVKLDETADEKPQDYLENYLPLDRRPMSQGWKDRYGSFELNASVGFVPLEHKEAPASVGTDAVSKQNFVTGKEPKPDIPDRKYLVRATKYGTTIIQSDVGYSWQRQDNVAIGEFYGDFVKDRDWEINRSKYLLKLFNENEEPTLRDQRRFEIRTRAGHKFEMRDVGWASWSAARSGCDLVEIAKTRDKEYGDPRMIAGAVEPRDERWIKWRTKGGHLVQLMDAGFHPEEDNFYKKLLLEECGVKSDKEQDHGWTKRDARQVRVVTRWGTKFVLDDRGTDPKAAELNEIPRANGWMLKTRRSWESSPATPRGFAIEANDKDELNTTRWYTPKSKVVEMNDNKDYTLVCTDTKRNICREWKGLEENEFALKIGMTEDPEKDTYHLKLDKANGYLRLKSAAGGDNGRRFDDVAPSAQTGLNQGLEARDGRVGEDGAWTELVDIEHRGMWLSKKEKLGIWRSKRGKDQYILIHDGKDSIVIRNNAPGPMQIYCMNDVQIMAGRNIALKATNRISLKAGQDIVFEAANSGHARLTGSAWITDVPDSTGSTNALNPQPITQDKREPSDRGFVGNSPFEEVDEEIVTGCPKEESSPEQPPAGQSPAADEPVEDVGDEPGE